jgi:hypothetical protein
VESKSIIDKIVVARTNYWNKLRARIRDGKKRAQKGGPAKTEVSASTDSIERAAKQPTKAEVESGPKKPESESKVDPIERAAEQPAKLAKLAPQPAKTNTVKRDSKQIEPVADWDYTRGEAQLWQSGMFRSSSAKFGIRSGFHGESVATWGSRPPAYHIRWGSRGGRLAKGPPVGPWPAKVRASPCGPDFGRILIGKASQSVLRPACGLPESRF